MCVSSKPRTLMCALWGLDASQPVHTAGHRHRFRSSRRLHLLLGRQGHGVCLYESPYLMNAVRVIARSSNVTSTSGARVSAMLTLRQYRLQC
jgi:hypothetical protein